MYAVMLTILLFISLLAKHVKTSKKQITFKQYAHSVFLYYPSKSKASEGPFCGGSLILAQVVVTSAACLEQMHFKDRITAYFGSSQPNKAKANLRVLSYKIHPKYKTDNIIYNLGVVFLGKPPPLGPYIKKIILPVGSRHNKWNDEYKITKLKTTMIPKLPALVKLVHDLAKKLKNSNKQPLSYTRIVASGAVTERMPELSGRKNWNPSKDEAFMFAWTKKPALVSSNLLLS